MGAVKQGLPILPSSDHEQPLEFCLGASSQSFQSPSLYPTFLLPHFKSIYSWTLSNGYEQELLEVPKLFPFELWGAKEGAQRSSGWVSGPWAPSQPQRECALSFTHVGCARFYYRKSFTGFCSFFYCLENTLL